MCCWNLSNDVLSFPQCRIQCKPTALKTVVICMRVSPEPGTTPRGRVGWDLILFITYCIVLLG